MLFENGHKRPNYYIVDSAVVNLAENESGRGKRKVMSSIKCLNPAAFTIK